MKNISHFLLILSAFALAAQSAPVDPFVKQENPGLDTVPTGNDEYGNELPDDRNLPKVVPIPVKFFRGDPHFLLTQVKKEWPQQTKAPEFPRGKAKEGEASWQTALREAYEEVGARGDVDHKHKINVYDHKNNAWLTGHILTVPAHQALEETAEARKRISKFHHYSDVERKLKRPEMKEMFHGAMERINNH